MGFLGGPVVKNSACSVRDTGLIPGPGGSHGSRHNYASESQLLKPLYPRVCAPPHVRPPQ